MSFLTTSNTSGDITTIETASLICMESTSLEIGEDCMFAYDIEEEPLRLEDTVRLGETSAAAWCGRACNSASSRAQ